MDDNTSEDVRDRRFDLERDGHVVPGVIWTPENAHAPRPVVLFGHGANNNKRADYIVPLATSIARNLGFACVSIDAPGHGDRINDGTTNDPTKGLDHIKTCNDDLSAVLDEMQKLDEVGVGKVGYWGLSMGTATGLPFVAREPRVDCAVLGLAAIVPGFESYIDIAATIKVPLLYVVQLDDELFTRDGMLQLFDSFGSEDKTFHGNPGRHVEVPQSEFDHCEAFFAKHLGA